MLRDRAAEHPMISLTSRDLSNKKGLSNRANSVIFPQKDITVHPSCGY